jgi:hypothetical protein
MDGFRLKGLRSLFLNKQIRFEPYAFFPPKRGRFQNRKN